jgi:hypothetical protein
LSTEVYDVSGAAQGGLASASFHWETKWERVLDYNFDLNKGAISVKYDLERQSPCAVPV